jgi:hypothetical protein
VHGRAEVEVAVEGVMPHHSRGCLYSFRA